MNSSDFLSLIQHYQTHPVPQRYNAAIVCASIAVSILGSYTTLLLLGRRTGKAGVRNFVLLVMAAGTMASVGIW
jgi:NO-binding membrane sensor protein with MHYT domain